MQNIVKDVTTNNLKYNICINYFYCMSYQNIYLFLNNKKKRINKGATLPHSV
jgi:hypothetical protein